MATIWSDATGKILAIVRNYGELATLFPTTPPTGTITTLDFDETANASLLADVLANQNSYALLAGPTLQKNGTTVAVISAGSSTQFQAALTQLHSITPPQIQGAVTALLAGTATSAQQQKAIAFLILQLAQKGLLF